MYRDELISTDQETSTGYLALATAERYECQWMALEQIINPLVTVIDEFTAHKQYNHFVFYFW